MLSAFQRYMTSSMNSKEISNIKILCAGKNVVFEEKWHRILSAKTDGPIDIKFCMCETSWPFGAQILNPSAAIILKLCHFATLDMGHSMVSWDTFLWNFEYDFWLCPKNVRVLLNFWCSLWRNAPKVSDQYLLWLVRYLLQQNSEIKSRELRTQWFHIE